MASTSFSTEALALTRGQLLDLLLDVEERLKLLIRAVFVREAAEDWISPCPEVDSRGARGDILLSSGGDG